MALRLTIPLPTGDGDFDPYTYEVPVKRARLVANDHNHADTLSVEVDWIDAGLDPRFIAGGTCEFYLGNADGAGEWEPDDKSLQFLGRMVKPARSSQGDTLTVELEFHDYTSFFLLAKPFASDGVPLYSDDLRQAWARICEHVPGAEDLADNIEFLGVDKVPKIGDAVAERFRKLGKLHVTPATDAWAVWQQCVGAMGLLSFIDLDQCIVTTALDFYTAGDPPRLVWGKNLLSFSEQRNNDFALRGVGLTSFDPLTGRTIEVIHDPHHTMIRPSAKKRTSKKGKPPRIKYDYGQIDFFQYPGVTSEEKLKEIAERVYEERSRQAMEGSLSTVDFDADTANGEVFDLLTLGSGDLIEVRFLDSDDAEFLRGFDSKGERVAYLVERGYTTDVANVLAANVDSITDKSSQFYVKSVEAEIESTNEGGSFKITVNYINKIDPKTGASA